MKILDDLLSTIRQVGIVKDIRQGPFQTAVLTHNCGLAAIPHERTEHQNTAPVKDAGKLTNRQVLEIAKLAYSSNLFEAAIGMATINSVLEVNENDCVDLNAKKLIAEKAKGKKAALIGHFPFVPELRKVAGELWVIEQHPREGDFTQADAENLVPQADVVGITGTAFTNHTIEHLLHLCRPEAYVIVLGGTTPLSPVLFDHGINAISGTKVINPEAVLQHVSQGATFRQITGIRLLTMRK